jgi:septum site-determining protein MinC
MNNQESLATSNTKNVNNVNNVASAASVSPTTLEVTSFVLKGSLYALTSLQLQNSKLDNLDEHIKLKIAQAPKFFQNSPIVIDLSKLPEEHIPDFKKLLGCLRNNNLMPIGVRKSPNELVNAAALENNLAILAENKSELKSNNAAGSNTANAAQDIAEPTCKVITTPVRSGQQVYARGGDLIILAPVSHGAEILADGSIHVYGPLRGRALAGVMNNNNAHIFCQSLEAELVSIGGAYQVSENLRDSHWKQAVHIHLNENNLQIDKM